MAIPVVPITGTLELTPDPYQGFSRFRIWRNARGGNIEMQYTRNSGGVWKTLLPEPPTNAPAGLVPTLQSDGSVSWQPQAASTVPAAVTYGTPLVASSALVYADLQLAGVLKDGRAFGFYVAPPDSAIKCYGTQMFLQSPAAGGDTKVEIIDEAGQEMSRISTLPAGVTVKQTLFDPPYLNMPAGSIWRLKVKQAAPDDPGEFLSVRLILAA